MQSLQKQPLCNEDAGLLPRLLACAKYLTAARTRSRNPSAQPRRNSDVSTPPDTPRARLTRRSCSSSPLSSQTPPHSGHSSIFTCSACCSFRSAPQRGHLLWCALRPSLFRSASSFIRISWMISRFFFPKYSSSFLLGFSSIGMVAPKPLIKSIDDGSRVQRLPDNAREKDLGEWLLDKRHLCRGYWIGYDGSLGGTPPTLRTFTPGWVMAGSSIKQIPPRLVATKCWAESAS